ncbi:MAG TPA: hypothetical protein VF380_09265 [Solirubrobacteraceae bacterium]
MSMRPSLLQTIGGSRDRRRHRGRRAAASLQSSAPAQASSARPARVAVEVSHPADPAVQRVRDAGGPIDCAMYTCECGYAFSAPVSTTVHCPHCGTGQAW